MGHAMWGQRGTDVRANQAWLQQPRARSSQHDQRPRSRMGAVRRGSRRAAEKTYKLQVPKLLVAEAQFQTRASLWQWSRTGTRVCPGAGAFPAEWRSN